MVIVGNITLGGTGKTPILISLAQALLARGLKPILLTRGYGGTELGPIWVEPSGSAARFGDEPLLLAQLSGCPVVVARSRAEGARFAALYCREAPNAEDDARCDILLCDDGLQHYALARDFEICVIDGARGLGNGHCLPVGPLREMPSRLQEVDFILCNGPLRLPLPLPAQVPFAVTQLLPRAWVNCVSGVRFPVANRPWGHEVPAAIAGIGNPDRFFATLTALDIVHKAKAFPDHHPYSAADLTPFNSGPLLMTAKDAVKCRPFAQANWWYLEIAADLPEPLVAAVLRCAPSITTFDKDFR